MDINLISCSGNLIHSLMKFFEEYFLLQKVHPWKMNR
jgi:hypothetical protein